MRCHGRFVNGPVAAADALSFVADPAHGAIDLFIGQVRNEHLSRRVSAIEFDAEPQLGDALLPGLLSEAAALAAAPVHLWLEHGYGWLEVGQASIVIAVSSPHREAVFIACRHLIEAAKTRLPVWKHEIYADGSSLWLPGTALRAPR